MAMQALTLPARLDQLAEMRRYVQAAGEEAGLSSDATYNLVLAVDELATNIVLHGYQEHGKSGDIMLSAVIDGDALSIVMEDRGVAFDPATRPMPSAEELSKPLEERHIGGLGIFLALNSVDDYRYQRLGEINRNTLSMKRGKT
jgi:anti-sigma regulatory factor (Ser/Thr protein kinase)